MDGGVDAHGGVDGVFAHELLVDFENALQLVVDLFAGELAAVGFAELGDVEIDLLAALDALAHSADAVDDKADDVSAEEIAVLGIQLFADIPAVGLGDRDGGTAVVGVSRYPDSPAFSPYRFRDEAAFVFAGNSGGVDLNHFGVTVMDSLLVADAYGRAGIDDRVGRASEDQAVSAGTHDGGVAGDRLDAHGSEVLGDNSAAGVFRVFDDAEKFPAFVFFDEAGDFPAADLLIEGIEKLLAGGCSGVGGPVL